MSINRGSGFESAIDVLMAKKEQKRKFPGLIREALTHLHCGSEGGL